MWFDNARTLGAEVQWYFVPDTTPFYPGPNLFVSETWDDVHWYCDGAGEADQGYPGLTARGYARWSNGRAPGVPKLVPCGKPEWFATGVPSNQPRLTVNMEGLPVCCFGGTSVYQSCSCSSAVVFNPGPLESCSCSNPVASPLVLFSCSCSQTSAEIPPVLASCACSTTVPVIVVLDSCSCAETAAFETSTNACSHCTITPLVVAMAWSNMRPAYAWAEIGGPCYQTSYPCFWLGPIQYVPGHGTINTEWYATGTGVWAALLSSVHLPGGQYKITVPYADWDGTQPYIIVAGTPTVLIKLTGG